jgi:two-component system CheB/CheR fusion protein
MGAIIGTLVTFTDVTAYHRLQRELERSHQELETAYEELQSTNEELETMNEELQSTNDELQSINDQLGVSTAQLDQANAFLETVLTSLRAGVAVVDRDLRIRMWNRRAEDLWGLRSAEAVGQHLLNLDIGLPVEPLRPLLRVAMGREGVPGEVAVDAVNRRGRPIRVRVACSPLHGQDGSGGEGAIIVMEADPVEAAPERV